MKFKLGRRKSLVILIIVIIMNLASFIYEEAISREYYIIFASKDKEVSDKELKKYKGTIKDYDFTIISNSYYHQQGKFTVRGTPKEAEKFRKENPHIDILIVLRDYEIFCQDTLTAGKGPEDCGVLNIEH